MAFPSLRKIQDKENCNVADTTFLDKGLNFNLTSVCVGMGLAYCFMLMLLVASAFLRPEGDSWKQTKKQNWGERCYSKTCMFIKQKWFDWICIIPFSSMQAVRIAMVLLRDKLISKLGHSHYWRLLEDMLNAMKKGLSLPLVIFHRRS